MANTYHVHYDEETNALLGFYVGGVHYDIPSPTFDITEEVWLEALANNSNKVDPVNGTLYYEEPVIPVEEKIEIVKKRVQRHLDAQAIALGYDNIFTAVTYADEPAVPKFQQEGIALRSWRSAVWAHCYDMLAQWQQGLIQEPTYDEVIASLPPFSM